MSAYDFLADLLVIEVAHLGPDSLGGYLADMGARVVKVEAPGAGDQVRYAGALSMGTPDGFSFLHLRWNRGKESLGLDLHRPEGVALFKQLAARADVVIEGMRAGVLDRLGLGYEDLRGANPGLVYCSISGLGLTGPYAAQGSHGPSFDAFGGLGLPIKDSISKYDGAQPTAIGMHAMGLHAAVGVLSAVIRSRSTGKGALIEVAAAESSAHWLPDGVDTVLNPDHTFERPGFAGSDGRMIHWPRMENYRTRDGLLLYAQPLSPKFWKRFIALVERPDLEQLYQTAASPEEADAAVNAAMAEIFLTRDRADWLETLRAADIPATPVNTLDDLARDPHFLARDNLYEVEHPDAGTIRLTTTPVKTRGQSFAPALAPTLGEHSGDVLTSLLGLDSAEIERLKEAGTVA